MKSIKMFIMLFISITLGRCEQEKCITIPINDDKIFGECCVFSVDEDLRYKNYHIPAVPKENKDNTLPIKYRKSRQPSQDQRIKEVQPLQTNIDVLSPKPIIAARYKRPEKLNVSAPGSSEKLVVSIENDKVYGECNVFMKDEPLPHEIVIAIIQENISAMESPEGRSPQLSERIPPIQLPRPPPHFDLSSISRGIVDRPKPETRKKVYSSDNLEDASNKEIRRHHIKNDEAHIDIDDYDSDEEFNATTKDESERSSTYYHISNKPKDAHKHIEKNSYSSEQHTERSTLFTSITEVMDNETTPSKTPDEHVLKVVKDESNNTVIPVTEGISMTTTNSNISTSNSKSSGKSVVSLGNRHAIDVPPVGCPNGQGRDPSGTCVTTF